MSGNHTAVIDPPILQFHNCRLLEHNDLVHEDLWVRNGKILDPEQLFYEERHDSDYQIDCFNSIISPGFIELQINGGIGVDFSQPTDNVNNSVVVVAKHLLSHGVTSFCPTVVTSRPQTYKQILPQIERRKGGKHGAEVLGVHIEGPFISKAKKGAHTDDYISTFSSGFQDVVNMYGTIDNASIVTLAPELSNSGIVIEELTSRGIVVSIGHSVANLVQGEAAMNHGATFITHLFNAMLPFHHRDPGLVGLLTSIKTPRPVFYGMIADGIHTHPAAIRIAHRVHPEGFVLVTDAIAAMGLPVGTHHIGSQKIEIINYKKAVIAGTDTLCGSIASMVSCIKHYRKETGCSVVQALKAATLHPAQVLSIQHKKGNLGYGSDADLAFLDDDLNVLCTYIGGKIVWDSHDHIWARRHKRKCNTD